MKKNILLVSLSLLSLFSFAQYSDPGSVAEGAKAAQEQGQKIESYAKKTSGTKVLMYPKKYTSPTGEIEPPTAERLSANSANNVWIVFSDRPGNRTYTTEQGLMPTGKKMNYMDAFYVIGDVGNYLHLVKYELDPALFTKDYKLAKNLEDWGWAPKTNLVPWTRCLVDPTTKFTIKALSINSVENLNEIATYAKGKNLKIYTDPDLKTESTAEARLFDFLYVFKRSGEAILIATTDNINRVASKRAERKILGWVSKSVIKEWKDRITLEPNWDQEAVKERKAKDVRATIFSSQEAAESFKAGGTGDRKKDLWHNDPLSTTRKLPEWKRLPYIQVAGPDMVKTGAVTSVFNTEGKTVIKEDEQTLIEKAYTKLRENYRKVNLVFVIDGSSIMNDYYAPIISTVSECANKLDKLDEDQKADGAKGNTYKLGVVVYRDYSDNCGNGITDFQEKSLTSNYSDIAYFLTNEVKFASCNKNNTRRALYSGILHGIKQFQETEDQTNIIVLIGAGANQEKDTKVKADEVINQLALYRVGLLAFQAKHPADRSYDDFTTQMYDLIQKSSQKVQEQMKEKFPDRKYELAKFKEYDNNVFKLNCPKKSPIPGVMMYSDMLNPIDPASLNDQIIKTLNELEDAKEDVLAGMDSKLKGQGNRAVMDEGMYSFLSQMKVDIELLRQSSADNIQLFVDGYTPRTCDKLTYPLYKSCLFLSFPELSALINDLQGINQTAASKSQDRENMKKAFQSLLVARLGPKEAKKKMSSLTGADLMLLITNLPTKNTLLNKFKLDEITKEKVVSDTEIDQIRIDITNKLEDLERYKDEINSFMSNDINYYWVPEDLMP